MLTVYVAAPYGDAAHVRHVHERLLSFDLVPTSRWATAAKGLEDYGLSAAALRAAAEQNDADLRSSDFVLALARDDAGGEMFAECRIALEWDKPIVWVGRRILSAWRSGVVIAEDLDDAVRLLAAMRRAVAGGARGLAIAELVR